MNPVVFLISFFTVLYSIVTMELVDYEENEISFRKRLKFGTDHINKITNGKVEIAYDLQKGVYCKAKKDIAAREILFKIPKEYIICPADIFPFQFELAGIIYSHISRYINVNETRSNALEYLLTYHLMLMNYENSSEIYKEVVELDKEYYNSRPTKQMLEYVDSLPRVLYSRHMYEEEEGMILKLLGYNFKLNITKEIFDSVLPAMKKFVSAKTYDLILPWISNWARFKYFLGIILSRDYQFSIQDYEDLKGVKIDKGPVGEVRKQMMNDLSKNNYFSCIIPFLDLCKHSSTIPSSGERQNDVITHFTKNIARIAFSSSFKKGADIEYMYMSGSPNEKLILNYGFYSKNNPFQITSIVVPFSRDNFTEAKHEICAKKLSCFEIPFYGFYSSSEKAEAATFIDNIYGNRLSSSLVVFFKVNVLPNSQLHNNPSQIWKRIKKDQWIDYHNEVRAYAALRDCVKFNIAFSSLTDDDVVYSIHNTRLYYKENKEKIFRSLMLRYKYRLRRLIMIMGKERNLILKRNIQMAQKKIKEIERDQFRKIRHYYESANPEQII